MSNSNTPSKETCCDFCSFKYCDSLSCRSFHINLAGLTDNLNYVLLCHRGCMVTIGYECGEGSKYVTGRICNVGTDYVSLLEHSFEEAASESESMEKVITILWERIFDITWHDKNCSPCREWNSKKHYCNK
jgi:hypothetical protein